MKNRMGSTAGAGGFLKGLVALTPTELEVDSEGSLHITETLERLEMPVNLVARLYVLWATEVTRPKYNE